MLNTFFDNTFLINLDRRPDRLVNAAAQCKRIGLRFERFPAFDGSVEKLDFVEASLIGQPDYYWNSAAAGLVVSFMRIIETSIGRGYESILILEDDVIFRDDLQQVVGQWLQQVPSDWETLYFGALHLAPFIPVSQHVARITRSYHTHCWALHSRVFKQCLEIARQLDNPLDIMVANEIHPRGRSYCFIENISFQAAGYSDIMAREVAPKL